MSKNIYRKIVTAATTAALLILNFAPTASAASFKDLTARCVKVFSYIFDKGSRTNQEEMTESNLIFPENLSDCQNENDEYNIIKESPSLIETKVEYKDNIAQLVLTFDKEIRTVKVFNKNECLIFRSVDEYGMETVTKIWRPSIQQVSGTGNQVQIDLTGLAGQMDYELSLPEGMVTFMNNEHSDVGKASFHLENGENAVIVEQIHQHSPGEITITLNRPVVKEAAENVRNFEVEGTVVEAAELIENNSAGAIIVLKLCEDTLEESGRYDVTVKPLSSLNSWIRDNAETTKKVYIRENVVPKLHSVGFPNITNDLLEVVLTFSEEMKPGIETDFDLVVDGKAVSERNKVTLSEGIHTTGTQLIAKWERDVTYEDGLDLVNAESILLKAKESIALKDLNGNITNVDQIIIK